jgi:hypothetical protein
MMKKSIKLKLMLANAWAGVLIPALFFVRQECRVAVPSISPKHFWRLPKKLKFETDCLKINQIALKIKEYQPNFITDDQNIAYYLISIKAWAVLISGHLVSPSVFSISCLV